MKAKSSLLVLCSIIAFMVFSCKSDANSEKKEIQVEKDSTLKEQIQTLTGEFIHVDTAAVLKVENSLYGVKMDEMARSVIQKADNIKTDDYDVINVIVKAEISPNTQAEGWDEIVTIKKLDKIYKPQKKDNKTLNTVQIK